MAYQFLAYPCSCELSEVLLGCVSACGQGFCLRLVTARSKAFPLILICAAICLFANHADPVLFSAISMWYWDTSRAVLAQVGHASPRAKEAENRCRLVAANDSCGTTRSPRPRDLSSEPMGKVATQTATQTPLGFPCAGQRVGKPRISSDGRVQRDTRKTIVCALANRRLQPLGHVSA